MKLFSVWVNYDRLCFLFSQNFSASLPVWLYVCGFFLRCITIAMRMLRSTAATNTWCSATTLSSGWVSHTYHLFLFSDLNGMMPFVFHDKKIKKKYEVVEGTWAWETIAPCWQHADTAEVLHTPEQNNNERTELKRFPVSVLYRHSLFPVCPWVTGSEVTRFLFRGSVGLTDEIVWGSVCPTFPVCDMFIWVWLTSADQPIRHCVVTCKTSGINSAGWDRSKRWSVESCFRGSV